MLQLHLPTSVLICIEISRMSDADMIPFKMRMKQFVLARGSSWQPHHILTNHTLGKWGNVIFTTIHM